MLKGNSKGKSQQVMLPGVAQFIDEHKAEEPYFFDGQKNEKYFDAGNLPDAPGYQANAHGATTYVLYLLFPDKESQERALKALTNGGRSKLAPGAKIGSLNCIKPVPFDDGEKTFIEYWEEKLLGIFKKKVKKPKKVEPDYDPDEAQAPI